MTFTMEHQTQTNWCWAAVSTSVSKYFKPASTWTQCRVVNAELGQRTCCVNGGTAACNKPWYLDRALTRTGNFKAITGVAPQTNVSTEMTGKRPLCARIGWSGGGGHFVAITDVSRKTLTIDDPWYGRSYYAYSTFKTAYKGTGAWTHSYYTKKA